MNLRYSKYISALKISLIYSIIGILWIVFSDQIAHLLFHNSEYEGIAQTIKGTFFIISSATLIFYLIQIEIKKKEKINMALEQTKQRLYEAQELGKIGNWEYIIQENVIYGSKEANRIFGRPEGEIFSSNDIAELIHPDDKERYINHTKDWINGNEIEPLTFKIVVNQQTKYIFEKANVIKNKANEIIRLYGTIQDITVIYNYQKELKESIEKYKFIFNSAGVGITITNLKGEILEFNNTWLNITGYNATEFKNLAVEDLYADKKNRDRLIKTLLKKKEVNHHEAIFRHKNGSLIWANLFVKIINFNNTEAILTIGVEITKRKQIQQELEISENRYKQLFMNMNSAFAYHEIVTDKKGKPINYVFLDVNPTFEKITGLKRKDVLGQSVLDLIPTLRHGLIETYGDVALNMKSLNFIEDSKELNRQYEVSAYSPVKGKFATTFNDITERMESSKKIEDYQNKLKKLILQLFITEENEKRLLAIDLHDHFSQLLALSKMKMAEFMHKHKEFITNKQLVDSKKYIDEALNKARSITYELSPPILYELGLMEAMDWYIDKTQAEHNIDFKFFKNIEFVQLNQQIQIIIFRIFTELVMNIIKHAKANSVLVIIEHVNDMFYLRVSDNGVGFDPEAESANKNSFGLFSIIERVEQMKGIAHIVSAHGKGTVVDISIPIR